MFGNWKRNRQIREVAKDITPKLALKYGEKADYSKGEIDWALKENGKTDNTFTLITYGMLINQTAYVPMGLSQELGEHAEWAKQTVFDIANRVPFMMKIPGVTENGLQTSKLVELVDIFQHTTV